MDADKAHRERLTHPLMDQYIEPHPLPDRIDVAWQLFSMWCDIKRFTDKLEAVGLTSSKSDFGIRAYKLEHAIFECFGIWAPGKKLMMIMEDVRQRYEAESFYIKERPNPFTEFCDVLYEVRAHALGIPMLTIAERSGGDPLDRDADDEKRREEQSQEHGSTGTA